LVRDDDARIQAAIALVLQTVLKAAGEGREWTCERTSGAVLDADQVDGSLEVITIRVLSVAGDEPKRFLKMTG
jgi:hypothetical protein